MKRFEELWEEAGGGICGKRACEKYYRAALEFALSQETVKPLLGGSEHRYVDSMIIRKELEE